MNMDKQYPYLEVEKPDGKEEIIRFYHYFQGKQEKNCITMGRWSNNDIILPDPDKKISRQHCAFQLLKGRWWLVDEDSANGTFLQRPQVPDEIDVRWDGKIALKDGDKILILARLSEENGPIFWQLTFRDPGETEQVMDFHPSISLTYSLKQEKLERTVGSTREEINLTPQQSAVINYMARKNWEDKNQSVLCRYEELIEAIAPDSFGYNKNSVTRLVWEIRNKIETDSGQPRFLKTVRGQGYRLEIRILG